MRQGNQFNMWVNENKEGFYLRVPMELGEEWSQFKNVLWIDNLDGTYTLIPSKEF